MTLVFRNLSDRKPWTDMTYSEYLTVVDQLLHDFDNSILGETDDEMKSHKKVVRARTLTRRNEVIAMLNKSSENRTKVIDPKEFPSWVKYQAKLAKEEAANLL